jgi:ketosteroid isomerase-like protein
MKPLTVDVFDEWLTRYSQASQQDDARASAELFAQDACYYESPFGEPLIGREAIYRYWQQGAETLRDKTSSHEIWAVRDNRGIARWQSHFVNNRSGQRAALDCVFLVEFDEDGLCRVFREWWHMQVLDPKVV